MRKMFTNFRRDNRFFVAVFLFTGLYALFAKHDPNAPAGGKWKVTDKLEKGLKKADDPALTSIDLHRSIGGFGPIIIYPSEGMSIALDACAKGPAVISFEVSALDESGEPVIPEVGSATGWVSQPQGGGNRYLGVFRPGVHTVLITATDAAGQTRQEDFTVTVTRPEAPATNLSCSEQVNIVLDQQCSFELDAANALSGQLGCLDEMNFTIQVQDANPANGNLIDGPGTFPYHIVFQHPAPVSGFTGRFDPSNWLIFDTPASVQATDSTFALVSFGADLTAAFHVFQDSGDLHFQYDFSGGNVVCHVLLLDENGNPVFDGASIPSDTIDQQVQPGWALLLALDGDELLFDFPSQLILSDFTFHPAQVHIPGFSNCWGTVLAEDNTPPEVNCPPDISAVEVPKNIQLLSDSLRIADPVIHPAIYSCLTELANQIPGQRHYRLFNFTVSKQDIYSFTSTSAPLDATGALFQGDFIPSDPCQNILAKKTGMAGTNFSPRMTLSLQPGQVYTLWTSSLLPDTTGHYTWTIWADQGGKINGLATIETHFTFDLLCTDLDKIFNHDSSHLYTGLAQPSDNCQAVIIDVSDTLSVTGDCSPFTLGRTYMVSDSSGNTVTCTQNIFFRRPTPADVVLPPFTAVLECDSGFPVDLKGHPAPQSTGYPFVETAFGIFSLLPAYCNLGASYTDQTPIHSCEGAYKILRQWTILDWCNPGTSFLYNQIIKVGDFTGPVITLPAPDYDSDGIPDLLSFSTGPFDCTAVFPAPQAFASDVCSGGDIHLSVVLVPAGGGMQGIRYPGENGFFTGIPPGCHSLLFTARDGCGNESQAEMPVWVEDRVAPVAICNEEIRVSLNEDGNAHLEADDVDEGSSDNCGPTRIEIRRKYDLDPGACGAVPGFYSPWGSQVDFTCCDAGSQVLIELRIWDDRNGDGIPGNTIEASPCNNDPHLIEDKSSTCWVMVPVEDKRAPGCTPPAPVVVNCNELPYNFDITDEALMNQLFGEPQADDNCSGATVTTMEVADQINDCGNGQIIRNFRATDAHGLQSQGACRQVIQVVERNEYEIKFPRYASANCGIPNPDTIFTDAIACDLLAVNVYDEKYNADADECYKLVRRYRVINWCEYDGISPPIVISADEDCDGIPGDEAVWVLVRPDGQTYIDRDNQENNANPQVGTSRCATLPRPAGHWANSATNPEIKSTGFWEYTQVIKVYDNTPPEIIYKSDEFCSKNPNCLAEVVVPVNVIEACTPDDVEVQVLLDTLADGYIDGDITEVALEGFRLKYVISGQFPMGMHQFRVVVRDGCGNVSVTDIPFSVVDCLGPSPICIHGLSAELSPVIPPADVDGDGNIDNCAVTVLAADLIASPTPDCSPPVYYSVNRVGEPVDSTVGYITLTTEDLAASSPTLVEVHAFDGAGNQDFCQTYVQVQDNLGFCSGDGMISGRAETEEGEGIAGVQVNLNGNPSLQWITGGNGFFLFLIATQGYDYSVTAHLDDDPLNGVSTFDLVLLAKHILGVQLLDSPYKMIAADVNNSKNITTLDAIQLRKMILNVETQFANNTSWRFVPESYEFPVYTDPWVEPFPEILNFNDFYGDHENQDFIGIKIGDLNGSVLPNAFSLEPRQNRLVFYLEAEDQFLRKGETTLLEITSPDLDRLSGFQGTLIFDPAFIRILSLQHGLLQPQHISMRQATSGVISMSWNTENGLPDPENRGNPLFSLLVEAKRDLWLSEIFQTGSGQPEGQAYLTEETILDLGLRFMSGGKGFELFQNQPNPFESETTIRFRLPAAGEAMLVIRDLAGREITTLQGEFPAGENLFELSQADLKNASGVLFYTVTAGPCSATRRMMVVR